MRVLGAICLTRGDVARSGGWLGGLSGCPGVTVNPRGLPSSRARSGHAVRPDRTRSMAFLRVIIHLDFWCASAEPGELHVSVEASEMVSIPVPNWMR